MAFTHLEVHSHFSLLGGTASPASLAGAAAAAGLAQLALTDANALYGAMAFARACAAAGVQPIVGMTMTVTGPTPEPPYGRLVLLARNAQGYRSLCRLASRLQAGGYGSEAQECPALSWDDLRAERDGLICLSGGRRGWIERHLVAGDRSAAQVYAGRLAGIFGEDACLAVHLPAGASAAAGVPRAALAPAAAAGAGEAASDLALAREVASLGQRLGLPVAAVQPVFCLAPAEVPKLRLLAAIRGNCRLDEVPAEDLPAGDEWHWLAPAEVAARFASLPEAVAMAGEVAARCGAVLPDGRPIWPVVPLAAGQSPDTALAQLSQAGLAAKYGVTAPAATGREPARGGADLPSSAASGARQEGRAPRGELAAPLAAAQQRLDRELATIAEHGYAPLFLVVADIVRFARESGVPVSTRGSVANSLAAYCAGITDVDPLAHGLLFERFLSPARRDAPDIDLDLCSRRRDEVLDYVRRTYGADRVALVGTVSTLRLASAVRAVGKVYGLPEEEIGRLAARLPRGRWRLRPAASPAGAAESRADDADEPDNDPGEAGADGDAGEAGENDEPAAAGPSGRDDELARALTGMAERPAWVAVVRDALTIEGQPDHMSVHPGGVVITPGPLTDVVPVQWAPKGFLITQYEHDDVAALGLPKIDLLGVRALTVLADAAELVRRVAPDFRLEAIPPADRLTGALLAAGDTIGVFQCESDGARATLRKLATHDQAGLAVANAFFKPGPATGGMAGAFIRRYRGEERATFLHPSLAPILWPTKGVLIFQEQVLRIATEVAGLSWGEADRLRRGMSHMEPAAMHELQARFVAGCRRRRPAGPGLSETQAGTLWEQVAAFAGYGFNQGHALAYAAVSYRSAYLRAHWPAEFLCARLADAGGFHHPAIYLAECVRLGFAVRPPHVNHSDRAFTLEQGAPARLWMGLGQVRDLRSAAVAAIIAGRRERPFAGLGDLLDRVDLQPREVRHLVQCGAADDLPVADGAAFPGRAGLLPEAEALLRRGRSVAAGVRQLAFAFDEPLLPDVPAEAPSQRCAWEAEILGLPLSALADPQALLTAPAAEALPPVADRASLAGFLAGPPAAAREPALALRLPGWTGGPGFFLWDGRTLVSARLPKSQKAPPPWQPLLVRGHRGGDRWGSAWLEIDELHGVGA